VPPIFPHEFRRTVLWILLLIASDLTPTGLSPSLAVHSRTFGFSQEALEKVLTPHLPPLSGRHSVCLLPLSIAFNNGISFDFFSSGYEDVSIPRVTPPYGVSKRQEVPFGHPWVTGSMRLAKD